MTRQEVSAVIEEAKQKLAPLSVYMESEATRNPDKVNAVILMTAVDEGEETLYNGAVFGDTPSIITTLINAFENNPQAVELFKIAIMEYESRICNCPNCTAEREAAKQNTNA